jgi:hypothetical protein
MIESQKAFNKGQSTSYKGQNKLTKNIDASFLCSLSCQLHDKEKELSSLFVAWVLV